MRKRGLQGRLTLFVVLGAGTTLAALVAGFNLVLHSSLEDDANQVLAARTDAALETIAIRSGRISRTETPGEAAPDAQVWIYSGAGAVERPPASVVLQRRADSLAGGPRTYVDVQSPETRLYARPVNDGARRVGTVVAALSIEPYEQTERKALIASLLLGSAALLLIAGATQFVVRRALRPVARMTAEARDWSEHDLDHRFNAGKPHDELTGLAATFDSMLEQLAGSLRREQRFTAEISHELRTPLAAITAETELALRREREPGAYREALANIASKAGQLELTLDALLIAVRAEGGASGEAGDSSDAAASVARVVAALDQLAIEHGVRLWINGADQRTPVGVAAAALERALSPVVENACRYAKSAVEVSVEPAGPDVRIVVSDDGPGVDPGERELIFEPGSRGSAAAAADGGAGLGLTLARRLAAASGGSLVALERGPGEGASFELRVPASRS